MKSTTFVKLRKTLGLTQLQMANLVNKSIQTIQSLEYGRLQPSQHLLERFASETGVAKQWLEKGNPKSPPISERGEVLTKSGFERLLCDRHTPDFINLLSEKNLPKKSTEEDLSGPEASAKAKPHNSEWITQKNRLPDFSDANAWLAVSFPVAFQIQQLFAILASANEKGAFRLCSYKIEAFLASLEKEFGADKVIDGLEYYSLPTSKDSTSSGIIDLAPLVQMFYRRLEEQTQNQPRKIATDGNYEVQFHPPGAERLPDGNYFLRIDVAETGFHH